MKSAEKVFTQFERRLNYERRQFSFTFHIPERRAGKDRRGVNPYNQATNPVEREFKPVFVQPSR